MKSRYWPNDSSGIPDTVEPIYVLNKIATRSVRQYLWSTGSAAGIALAAYALHFHAWLGLFGMLLVPTAITSLVLSVESWLQVRCPSWPRLWMSVLAAMALSAWLMPTAYQRWGKIGQLSDPTGIQVTAVALGLVLLLIVLPLWRGQRDAYALHMAELKRTALAAELKALQAQVEPHFLYNTLANARYLARHAPDEAVRMLDHLIAYLHSALPNMRSVMSTAGKEFDLARHYLALIAIRFGDRLHYDFQFPSELEEVAIPPLMLISLVENAVKHGVEPQPGNVGIYLSAEAVGDTMHIRVKDTGAGIRTGLHGGGVGLRNLRERLAALYNSRASFSLRSHESGGTEAELIIPLEKKKND